MKADNSKRLNCTDKAKNVPKVLVFVPYLTPGGAERVVINLLKGIATDKFDVFLVIVSKKKAVFVDQIPLKVRLIDMGKKHAKSSIFAFSRILRAENPDIILSHMDYGNIITWIALKLSKVQAELVITEHNTLSKTKRSGLFKILMRKVYPRVTQVVAVSTGVAKDLISELRLDSNKVQTIYNPIVDKDLKKCSEQGAYAGLSEGTKPYILAAGRLTEQKDYPTLLKAFRIVRERINIRLLILGEGHLKEELENLAKRLEVQSDVRFLGFQKNPYVYMRHADLLVLSSAWEGFGNVLVEAMACECPVVSTDCMSGPREILKDGECGLLVPVGDQKALAEAMLRVLTDRKLSKKLKTLGYERAKDFEIEKIAEKYENLFYNILTKAGNR